MREYFHYAREVTIARPGKQNYFVVDAPIWAHAHPDLADLRLYDHDTQVPYAISEQQAESSMLESEALILNLGVRNGRTEFDLDVGGVAEYNRVQLHLKATNFVASATVDGSDALHGNAGRRLSTSTLYDFSRESLGNNFALRVPMSTFRYLHVSITPAIAVREINGASTSAQREMEAKWISAGRCHAAEQISRVTRIACDIDPGIPAGRILFAVPQNVINFRRAVSINDSQGTRLCGGNISRIRMKSAAKEVVTEDLAISFCNDNNAKEQHLTLEIDDGDNAPLAVQSAEPQSLEHRIYFDPAGKTTIQLYYGDEKLAAPIYDYAKFFRKEADAVQAALAAESLNAEFTGRPDERPWSERHNWVLWGAMLIAVVVLAALALKGFTGDTPAHN
jgi:hypothetical protein